jgi:hypothetical protein
LALLLLTKLAPAQEIFLTQPLKAAPAGGHFQSREKRWLLAPSIGTALRSRDRVSLVIGGEGLYHPTNWLGFGTYSHVSVPFTPARTAQRVVLAPELVLIPFAHRAGLFDAIYFPYDLHVEAGAARVWSGGPPGFHGEWAVLAGAGFNAFSGSFFSTSLDYRTVIGSSIEQALVVSFGFWLGKRQRGE